ncbi:MAG: GGDEF domain-containing protein [Pirellulaceae bacterium]
MGFGNQIPPTTIAWVVAGLCVLFASGLLLRRILCRRADRRTPALDEQHVGKLMQNLFQWTDGLANDVSQHRRIVDSLKRQVGVVEQQSRETDSAAVVRLLSKIVQANDYLQQQLDTAELTLMEQAAEITSYMSEARTDTLTGLPNRRAFEDALAREVAEFHRHETCVSVAMIDIDFFKRFNDRYGHQAGDAVLVHVSQTLRKTMRETDLVARLGGEEFVILMSSLGSDEAKQAADRARSAIEQSTCQYEGQTLSVTNSCGLAMLLPVEDGKQLVNRADQALYASKSAGRNCVHWHSGQDCLLASKRPAAARPPGGDDRPSVPRQRKQEEYLRLCDELRRKLIDVVGQQA